MTAEQKLKPCPFCGEKYLGFDDIISVGTAENPSAWWDSGLRGERYGYVMCYECGVILKANDLLEAIKAWNRRSK